ILRAMDRTRNQEADKARDIQACLDQVEASQNLLLMDAACFREWARLMEGKSEHLLEGAMIAATARVHRLEVATRNTRDFSLLKGDFFNSFKYWRERDSITRNPAASAMGVH